MTLNLKESSTWSLNASAKNSPSSSTKPTNNFLVSPLSLCSRSLRRFLKCGKFKGLKLRKCLIEYLVMIELVCFANFLSLSVIVGCKSINYNIKVYWRFMESLVKFCCSCVFVEFFMRYDAWLEFVFYSGPMLRLIDCDTLCWWSPVKALVECTIILILAIVCILNCVCRVENGICLM